MFLGSEGTTTLVSAATLLPGGLGDRRLRRGVEKKDACTSVAPTLAVPRLDLLHESLEELARCPSFLCPAECAPLLGS